MRAALVVVALAACGGPRATGPLSAPALMVDVRALADPRLDGRLAGSAGEMLAGDRVEQALAAAGLTPRRQAVPDVAGSENVYALVPGVDEDVIVIGAHLDHLGHDHPGADDDASGVAVLLAVARELSARRTELGRSVLVVAFAAEEPGRLGSQALVADPPVPIERMAAMVNLDMLGRPLVDRFWFRPPLYLVGIDRDRATGLTGARRYPRLRALVDDAFAAEGDEVVAAEDLPPRVDREVERQAAGRGDSTSFEAVGVPALFLGDGEGADYHSPRDTVARLRPAQLERRARAVARLVVALSRAPAADFASSEQAPPRRYPRRGLYLPLHATLALASDGDVHAGGEVGLVYLGSQQLGFAGLAADALHTGDRRWRVDGGPELGRGPFGVEADLVADVDHGEVVRRGVALRPFVSAALASLAVRVGRYQGGDWFAELSVSLGLPLRLR